MNVGVIIAYSIKSIMVTIICIILFALLFRKGRFFDYKIIRDEGWRKWALSHTKILDAISWAISCLLLIALIKVNIPMIKDIPYVMRGEYLTAEGTVLNDSMGGAAGRVQEREFSIIDEKTGERIHLATLSTGLKEGEFVKVTYLLNSHLATINHRGEGNP